MTPSNCNPTGVHRSIYLTYEPYLGGFYCTIYAWPAQQAAPAWQEAPAWQAVYPGVTG